MNEPVLTDLEDPLDSCQQQLQQDQDCLWLVFLAQPQQLYMLAYHVAKARTRLTIGIYLHRPLFSHGELDIALSRVGALQHLKVEDNKPMTMAQVSYIH